MFRPSAVPDVLTVDEAVERLRDLGENWAHDPEVAHSWADRILLAVLRGTVDGGRVAEAWDRLDKWYA